MNALTELIQNDSHAASFQSLAQYRAALISAASPQQVTKRGVYLSGPMTGLPEFNFPAFNAAAEDLRSEGLDVINPADHGVVDGWEWSDYLRRDIALLVTCSEIIMLPGWTRSKGALLEHHIATELGMVVRFYEGAEVATLKESLPAQGMPMGAWAVLTSNGNIRAWSEQRDHPTLAKLESEGAAVVRLAWPLLNAPALIDGVVVGKGCSTGHVVMIAKRKHQYAVETSPQEHARREKAFKDVIAQIHEGISDGAPEDLFEQQEAAAEQHSASWIHLSGDHVILSRCDWMYPHATEDSAGTRDEQRFKAVGSRDGDIVLPAPEGALDREDLKTMLAWPGAPQPAEQQIAPHPDDAAVDRFAVAMKDKLAASREKGRHGWQNATAPHLSALLYDHMYKADPLDVGNLAMMLHQNGQAIELPHEVRKTAAQPAPDVSALVDALDDIAKLPIDPCSTENDYRLSAAKSIANAALDARRKGGDV